MLIWSFWESHGQRISLSEFFNIGHCNLNSFLADAFDEARWLTLGIDQLPIVRFLLRLGGGKIQAEHSGSKATPLTLRNSFDLSGRMYMPTVSVLDIFDQRNLKKLLRPWMIECEQRHQITCRVHRLFVVFLVYDEVVFVEMFTLTNFECWRTNWSFSSAFLPIYSQQ